MLAFAALRDCGRLDQLSLRERHAVLDILRQHVVKFTVRFLSRVRDADADGGEREVDSIQDLTDWLSGDAAASLRPLSADKDARWERARCAEEALRNANLWDDGKGWRQSLRRGLLEFSPARSQTYVLYDGVPMRFHDINELSTWLNSVPIFPVSDSDSDEERGEDERGDDEDADADDVDVYRNEEQEDGGSEEQEEGDAEEQEEGDTEEQEAGSDEQEEGDTEEQEAVTEEPEAVAEEQDQEEVDEPKSSEDEPPPKSSVGKALLDDDVLRQQTKRFCREALSHPDAPTAADCRDWQNKLAGKWMRWLKHNAPKVAKELDILGDSVDQNSRPNRKRIADDLLPRWSKCVKRSFKE